MWRGRRDPSWEQDGVKLSADFSRGSEIAGENGRDAPPGRHAADFGDVPLHGGSCGQDYAIVNIDRLDQSSLDGFATFFMYNAGAA